MRYLIEYHLDRLMDGGVHIGDIAGRKVFQKGDLYFLVEQWLNRPASDLKKKERPVCCLRLKEREKYLELLNIDIPDKHKGYDYLKYLLLFIRCVEQKDVILKPRYKKLIRSMYWHLCFPLFWLSDVGEQPYKAERKNLPVICKKLELKEGERNPWTRWREPLCYYMWFMDHEYLKEHWARVKQEEKDMRTFKKYMEDQQYIKETLSSGDLSYDKQDFTGAKQVFDNLVFKVINGHDYYGITNENGEVAGHAQIQEKNILGTNYFEIRNVYVYPEHQRQGWGKNLLIALNNIIQQPIAFGDVQSRLGQQLNKSVIKSGQFRPVYWLNKSTGQKDAYIATVDNPGLKPYRDWLKETDWVMVTD
jgi:ribosomal protein S18 acetylase RimI-like enzyme